MNEQVAIVIPTRKRSQLLAPLAENIAAVTAVAHTIYWVVENGDQATIEALWPLAGKQVFTEPDIGLPQATNLGIAAAREPYVLVTNDDVWFYADWDTNALAKMTADIAVVGINQGNGRCDCFFLIDHSYIEQHGDFFFDGYRSQYCDTEAADIAKARGVYAEAPDALIEHRHWTFGKSALDENYRLAIASASGDQETYERRRAERLAA